MPTKEYADLEIRIRAQASGAYPVEVTCEGKEFTPGRLLQDKQPVRPTGEALFDWLLSDENFKLAWTEIQGRHRKRRIRLRIDKDAPELQLLPWESLRDARDQRQPLDLAATDATPFSRFVAAQWDPGQPLSQKILKIMVVISAPDDSDLFGLQKIIPDDEWNLISNVFSGSRDVELVRLQGRATLVSIEEQFTKGFHILHFVGHGVIENKQAKIHLQDDSGKTRLVSDQEFANLIGRKTKDMSASDPDRLRLVFLCSCQTSASSAVAFEGVGPTLISTAQVPAVIAMQANVRVGTAREFTQVFYKRLLEHGSVDRAVNSARSKLITQRNTQSHVPVLYMGLRDGLLFARPNRWLSGWRLKAAVAAILAVIALLLTLYKQAVPTYLEYSTMVRPIGSPMGSAIPLNPDRTLTEDYCITFKVTARQAGYLYIWNQSIVQDNAWHLALYHPFKGEASFIAAGESRNIPAKDCIPLGSEKGTEKTRFVFSKLDPIQEFEDFIKAEPFSRGTMIKLYDPTKTEAVERVFRTLKPSLEEFRSGEISRLTQSQDAGSVIQVLEIIHK